MAVPAKMRSSELYEQDLYAWSKAQADLLRRRRLAELDLEHVIEEIEDVGGSLYREVRSRIRTIMEHLLKLEYSAVTEPRAGWERMIRREHADLAEDLTGCRTRLTERKRGKVPDTFFLQIAALHSPRRASCCCAPPTACI